MKIGGHDFIDFGEMRQVGQVNIEFDYVVQATTSSHGDSAQILENAMYLAFGSFGKLHRDRVEGDLARKVDGVVYSDSLGIGSDSGRGIGSLDDLFIGHD